MLSLPQKPRYAAPCNHCGQCCTLQLCPIGEMAFPKAVAPCPALVQKEGLALCKIVQTEKKAGMEPVIQKALGIGCGCSMPDTDTSDTTIAQFEQWSTVRMYGKTTQSF